MKRVEDGYTIVELIVSMVVATILILALNAVVTSHLYISQRNRDLVRANAYAESKVESLRSIGFLGLADGTTDLTSELPSELSAPRSASQVIGAQAVDIKLITLTITYNEQGKTQSHVYKTFVGELGAGQY